MSDSVAMPAYTHARGVPNKPMVATAPTSLIHYPPGSAWRHIGDPLGSCDERRASRCRSRAEEGERDYSSKAVLLQWWCTADWFVRSGERHRASARNRMLIFHESAVRSLAGSPYRISRNVVDNSSP